MNEIIKQIKTETLERLKHQKQVVEAQKDAIFQQKFALKKQEIDEECAKLDTAFANYKQEKTLAYNNDIANKAQAIADKKQKLIHDATKAVQDEVNCEILSLTAEYSEEIAKLEKELA